MGDKLEGDMRENTKRDDMPGSDTKGDLMGVLKEKSYMTEVCMTLKQKIIQ